MKGIATVLGIVLAFVAVGLFCGAAVAGQPVGKIERTAFCGGGGGAMFGGGGGGCSGGSCGMGGGGGMSDGLPAPAIAQRVQRAGDLQMVARPVQREVACGVCACGVRPVAPVFAVASGQTADAAVVKRGLLLDPFVPDVAISPAPGQAFLVNRAWRGDVIVGRTPDGQLYVKRPLVIR